MIRDGILKTKHYELDNCVANRKRKLQELYFATVSFTEPKPDPHDVHPNTSTKTQVYDEAEFLQANDISKDRFFDISTLLRLGGKLLGSSKASPPPRGSSWSHIGEWGGPSDSIRLERALSHEFPSSQTSTPRDNVSLSRSPRSSRAGTPATRETLHDVEEENNTPKKLKVAYPQTEARVEHTNDTKPVSAELPDECGFSPEFKSSSQDIPTAIRSFPNEPSSHTPNQPLNDLPEAKTRNAKDAVSRGRGFEESNDPTETATRSRAPPRADARSPLDTSQPSDIVGCEGPQEDTSLAPATNPHQSQATPAFPAPGKDKVSEPASLGRLPEESNLAARRRGRSPDSRMIGTNQDATKGLTLSQRPPMRIDTGVARSAQEVQTLSSVAGLKSAQSAVQTSPPERMTTRVSSGALRHKSVSEILGETPRSAVHSGDRNKSDGTDAEPTKDVANTSLRSGVMDSSPDAIAFRSRLNELKEKEKDRNKLSTVVFARSPRSASHRPDEVRLEETPHFERPWAEKKDYLVTLFAAQANAQSQSLSHLLASAHKTLSTGDHVTDYYEALYCRFLKRIYHLQNSNRWSLRQIERSAEPVRPTTQWDMLLGEVKWLRTDFREERKWKLTAAKNLAEWCAEWVGCSASQRKSLQVRVSKGNLQMSGANNHTTPISLQMNGGSSHSEPTPELIHSADDDMSDTADDEIPHLDVSQANAPAALFSLATDDILFSLDQTPVSDKLLSELPLYQPLEDPRGTKRKFGELLDFAWQKPIVPVSKFTTGKIVPTKLEPVRKRSRYEYGDEDEVDVEMAGTGSRSFGHRAKPLPPEKDDVALFNPENKHIIARLHAAHAFRPPSEFSMPSQSFFESRQPSQWTLAEDDELRRCVREYEYNWSLVSSCLSSPSLYSSGAERRTPWECFERWVSFEGLPGDMARHQYFRAWNSRRDGARQHLEQLHPPQQQANGGHTPIRRRNAEPVGVDRRRNNKHLALIHGMSKVAKKKETAIQKQQHIASIAAIRKAAEPTPPRQRMSTPREFSAHKHKQDCEINERKMLYRQQLAANSRAVLLAQKAAQPANQQPSGPSVGSASRANQVPSVNGATQHLASIPQNINASSRAIGTSQPAVSGTVPNTSQPQSGHLGVRASGAVPQAQMQSYLPQQQRLSSQGGNDNARVILEASRLSEEQRLMQQRRQYQAQTGGLNGVTAPHQTTGMSVPVAVNAAYIANLQAGNGKLNGAVNGTPGQQRSSPGNANVPQGQQLSSGMIPVLSQLTSHFKQMHPGASPEQIKQMATASLNQHLRARNQQAGNNAAVNGNMQLSPQSALAFNASLFNNQLYAQQMRSQPASQQSRTTGGDVQSNRPESRGDTPQAKASNPPGSSQSPHMPQAQTAGSS